MVIKELRKATNTVVYRTFEMVMLWVVATYNSACVAMEIKNTKTSSALTATDLIVGQGCVFFFILVFQHLKLHCRAS